MADKVDVVPSLVECHRRNMHTHTHNINKSKNMQKISNCGKYYKEKENCPLTVSFVNG